MVYLALERVDSFELGDVRLGSHPNSRDKPSRCDCAPSSALDDPQKALVVPPRALDFDVVLRMARKANSSIGMVKVPLQLVQIWVPLRELETMPDIRVEDLVPRFLDIDPCAGITVPVPYPAASGGHFEDVASESELA